MRRLACLAFVLLLAVPARAEDGGESAQEIVRAIYGQFAEGGQGFDVPEMYFTPALLALWREADAAAPAGVEAALGFNIFTEAGEEDLIEAVETQWAGDRFVVASFMAIVEDATAIVGHRKYFMYTFVETPAGWKIDDIDWGQPKPTLRGLLEEVRAKR